MKDELTRRDFLKAAGFAVAGIAGASVLSRSAWAQEEEQKPEEGRKEEPKEDPNDLSGNKEPGEPTEPAEPVEEETRACPQCGALMYKQGRTWTCENCGYSYVE
jgi:ribosomal protein S27AE